MKHTLSISRLLSMLAILMLLASCSSGRSDAQAGGNLLTHAALLEMEQTDSFAVARVKDPWGKGRLLATYVLVDRRQPLPSRLPEGQVVRVPLERAVLTSAVHAALLDELGGADRVAGLADADYVVGSRVKALLTTQGGRVKPMGSSMQPDVEQMRAVGADAVWVSPFENAGLGALATLGVPVIECADYMETSPLGRAEWMRFYGRLVGQGERADSLFLAVERAYTTLAQSVAQCRERRPTVVCDLPMGATWYEPGGHSTMGRLLADAGAGYLWADRPESGSLTLDFESVFARGHAADVWLVKYGAAAPLTYRQMATDNPRFARFVPWQKRRVWACNTLRVPFYEETPFHPERLLADLVAIFHPSLLKGAKGETYYAPLAE